jgi:hypothetical protein
MKWVWIILFSFHCCGEAGTPAQYGVVEFFDCIEEGDARSARLALRKGLKFGVFLPSQMNDLFSFFVDELNRRYHCSFTPKQMTSITIQQLSLNPLGCTYLPFGVVLLKTMHVYNKEGAPTLSEEEGPEVALGIIVGSVECFIGVLCWVIPHPLSQAASAWFLGDGTRRILSAIPEQNEINTKWRMEHGF